MKLHIEGLHEIRWEEYEKLYEMLKGAFRNYEKLLGAYPDWEDRQAAIEMVISYYLAYDLKYGTAYSLDENIDEAIVICHSDDVDYSYERISEADCENDRFNLAASRLSAEQRKFWFDFFDEFDKKEAALQIPKPHIYVDYLAVRESLQGQGRGGRIVERLKEYSRETGLPVMLFTNGERDIEFYLKNGFRIIGVTESEEFCFKNTYMLYEPEAKSK